MKLKIKKSFRRKRINTKNKTRNQKGGNGLQVLYNNQKVLGQELSKNITQITPDIKFPTSGKLYTLVMWDPDVPQEIQPGFVHWLATNLQSQNDIQNNQILSYKGPSPPSGIHRYFFGLFEQQSGYISVKEPNRSKFSIDKFIKDNNLRKVYEVFMRVRSV